MGNELGDELGNGGDKGWIGDDDAAGIYNGGMTLMPVVMELGLQGLGVVIEVVGGEVGNGDFQGDRPGLLQ